MVIIGSSLLVDKRNPDRAVLPECESDAGGGLSALEKCRTEARRGGVGHSSFPVGELFLRCGETVKREGRVP